MMCMQLEGYAAWHASTVMVGRRSADWYLGIIALALNAAFVSVGSQLNMMICDVRRDAISWQYYIYISAHHTTLLRLYGSTSDAPCIGH